MSKLACLLTTEVSLAMASFVMPLGKKSGSLLSHAHCKLIRKIEVGLWDC